MLKDTGKAPAFLAKQVFGRVSVITEKSLKAYRVDHAGSPGQVLPDIVNNSDWQRSCYRRASDMAEQNNRRWFFQCWCWKTQSYNLVEIEPGVRKREN